MYIPKDIARYFIAIVLPSPIHDEALSLKNYFKEKYNSKASLNSPPHITLHMPFNWKEKNEQVLIERLKKFSPDSYQDEKKVFEIELSNFNCFEPRVIFIDVKKNEQLNHLEKELLRFCKTELNLFNARYKELPFHPHVTLAFRDLKKSMFDQAWNEFKDKTFSASFIVDKITLLKHDGKFWQTLQDLKF